MRWCHHFRCTAKRQQSLSCCWSHGTYNEDNVTETSRLVRRTWELPFANDTIVISFNSHEDLAPAGKPTSGSSVALVAEVEAACLNAISALEVK